MPLPFLKQKHQVGVIVSHRKPDGSNTASHMEGEEDQGLESAFDDLLRAINNKDSKAGAQVLKAIHEICDAYPHEEGEHTNEENENGDLE